MLGIHDRLELCAVMEEKLQMPMQEGTKLLHVGVAAVTALIQAKLAAMKLAGLVESDGWGAMTLEGELKQPPKVVNGEVVPLQLPAATHPDPETQRLIEEVKEMGQADRMLGLSLLGMAEQVVKLKRELGEAGPDGEKS